MAICHHRSAAGAPVWLAKRDPQSQSRCHPDRLIIQPKPAAGDGEGQQPVSRMLGSYGLEACLICWIGEPGVQTRNDPVDQGFVPC
jgi:hypothetical protein